MSNILLVEDDVNITESLTEFLSEEGFSIEAVKGQRAAFSKLEEKKYDLVLLDIFLTDGNGFNICREINCIITMKYTTYHVAKLLHLPILSSFI